MQKTFYTVAQDYDPNGPVLREFKRPSGDTVVIMSREAYESAKKEAAKVLHQFDENMRQTQAFEMGNVLST